VWSFATGRHKALGTDRSDMTGKLTREALEALVFSRTGASRPDVTVGPTFGEDAAAIDVGGETLVASTDPISLAAERIGTLAVAIASNDVAASGGVPAHLLATVLLPEMDGDLLDTITAQLDAEAERLRLAIVGGHTESVAGLARPLVSLTCLGVADRYVPSGGVEPGDSILLTKGAGVEATAVLATDFREETGLDEATLDAGVGFFDDLSVMPEAAVLSPVANAMHDPTEGGVLGGVSEMAAASGARIRIERDSVPVAATTRAVCDAVGVDPLAVLGSGALLAAVPPEEVDSALDALESEGVAAAEIGVAERGSGVVLDGEELSLPVRDEMYELWD
jgi:hydrogenase expression/formation protein HypE